MTKGDEKNDAESWSYGAWYAKNSKDLSERRKSRYQSDPEYRQRVIENNRKYRRVKAMERMAAPQSMVRIPRHRKPTVLDVEIGGVKISKQMVHVGFFARAIGRSVSTVHQWERNGVIPRTPFVAASAAKQERLYTAEMIRIVQDHIERRNGIISKKDPSFFSDIRDGWREIGIEADASDDEGEVASGR